MFHVQIWHKFILSLAALDVLSSEIRSRNSLIEYAQNHSYRCTAYGTTTVHAATVSAQRAQNREWPHGTRATPVRGARRHTSQVSSDCIIVCVSLRVVDDARVLSSCCVGCSSCSCSWSSSSASLSSSTMSNAAVCAPRLWLIVRRNCCVEYVHNICQWHLGFCWFSSVWSPAFSSPAFSSPAL